MKLLISQDGTDATVDLFLDASEAIDHPPVALWQQIMLRSAQKNFVEQGRPDAWEPLSETTIKRRRNKNKSTILILRDTGQLMQSLQPTGGEGEMMGPLAQWATHRITQYGAIIGTNRPGASNHQDGDTVPQRKFLLHQPEDIEKFETSYLDAIDEAMALQGA